MWGFSCILLLRKAVNLTGETVLGTSTSSALWPFYVVYSQVSTTLQQGHSAIHPAESSKAVLFSPFHISFSLQLLSSLPRELARKILYLFFLPFPFWLANSSLLLP